MAYVSSASDAQSLGARRPLVISLIVASFLLSIVSWYTTYQGMALYLSGWFAFLASLGIQVALVMVAWLIGFTNSKRGLLTVVYVITALVSVGFSYVSLYTWFSARERPATVQRQLYDVLTTASAKANQMVAASTEEAQKHVLALEEMTTAEKSHGYISRARDADPYLASVRDAVAEEARTYMGGYKEGTGEGLRYTAFDRYAKLAHQSLEKFQQAQASLSALRTKVRPNDPAAVQLRLYHETLDTLPWAEMEKHLHTGKLDVPVLPGLADYLDQTSGAQEDLMVAVDGLVKSPNSRHLFSLLLAAFIDIIVFLLAYSSGPYFFGAPEQRWCTAGAALEGIDHQLFTRDLLRKIHPSANGLARINIDELNAGERQLLMLLTSRGLALVTEEEGRACYVIDQTMHEMLMDMITSRSLPLRAKAQSATA